MTDPPSVHVRVEGRAGCITLDRPRALNALNIEMIRGMCQALDAFEQDAQVTRIIIDSASPKAFCAGGDIRAVAALAAEGRYDEAHRFLAEEYVLDRRIAESAKPCVALIDGYALGGGLGISVNGRYRVVTERATLAMPETIIGFFPDVGSSHFLSRLSSHVGEWLGLSGAFIGGADAAVIGLATHFVSSARLASLRQALVDSSCDTENVLSQYREEPHSFRIAALLPQIDAVFSGVTVTEMMTRLARSGTDWGRETLAQLEASSPSSLEVTLQLIRAGVSSTLSECLDRELEAAWHRVRHPDLVEGVRAQLVDKDRAPRWTQEGRSA